MKWTFFLVTRTYSILEWPFCIPFWSWVCLFVCLFFLKIKINLLVHGFKINWRLCLTQNYTFQTPNSTLPKTHWCAHMMSLLHTNWQADTQRERVCVCVCGTSMNLYLVEFSWFSVPWKIYTLVEHDQSIHDHNFFFPYCT
jgi:hypothetical protein